MHLSHISSFFVSTVMRLVLFHASANASAWTDEASNYISTIFPFYWIRSPDFHRADAIKTAVDEARRHYETTTGSLGVNVFHHETFGKQLCKEQKVSPDAMMQLGFQVRSTFSLSLSLSIWTHWLHFWLVGLNRWLIICRMAAAVALTSRAARRLSNTGGPKRCALALPWPK